MADDRSTRPVEGSAAEPAPKSAARRRGWVIALVAISAVTTNLVVWRILSVREDRLLEARFNLEADELVESIRIGFARDLEALTATGAFFGSTESVDRGEFHTFTAPLLDRSPGMIAIEWLKRVPRSEKIQYEKDMRRETGTAGIRCRDASWNLTECPSRAEYFPVTYSEPQNKFNELYGVDYLAESLKAAAMQRAGDTGHAIATPWLSLARLGPREMERQGVFIFLPTYAKAPPASKRPGRPPQLIGYLAGVVRIADVLEASPHSRHYVGIDIVLFDGPMSGSDVPHLVRRSQYRDRPGQETAPAWQPEAAEFYFNKALNVAGRPWLFVAMPTDKYLHDHHTWTPLVSLGLGLVLAGLLTGMVAALVGQTARVERQVTHRTAELKRSNEQLEAFAYAASHDLQEPLRAVAGYCQLLARRYQGKLDADADEFIQFAVQGAKRMQDLINDLLEYSRVSTRGNPFQEVDLNNVLVAVRENLEIAIAESGAIITSDALPTVWADATQMVQLLQNLVGNAIKYLGEQLPAIHVAGEESTAEWQLSVRDNGIGIDPRYAERIFAIFQRLHTREEYPGTGIGLAICKKIVERHGGRIWVKSEPGAGATFFFTLAKGRATEP